MKVFKEKGQNILTPEEWIPYEPKPQSCVDTCQTDQMCVGLEFQKPSSSRLISLGGPIYTFWYIAVIQR